MSLYRGILRQALTISWRNKLLWPFGFLAGFLGAGGSYEILFKGLNLSDAQVPFVVVLWRDVVTAGMSWGALGSLFTTAPLQAAFLILLILLAVALFVAVLWAVVVSQVAVIRGVDAIARQQSARGLVHDSRRYFWPVIGVSAVGKVIVVALFFLLAAPILAPLLSTDYSFLNTLIYLIAFIVVFLLSLSVAIMVILATLSIALKGQSFGQSIAHSWLLFKRHWLVCLETSFLLLALVFFFGIALFLAIIVSSVPISLLFFLIFYIKSVFLFWALLVAGIIITIALVFLISGFLWTYQLAVWTLLFEHLDAGTAESKLERWGQSALQKS